MSTEPTVPDDELLTLIELEHPLTSKEVAVITGMHPIEAHNRLMLLYGCSGRLDSQLETPEHRVWWPHEAYNGHREKADA